MFGPHFYFDLVRYARQPRTYWIRVGYLSLLLAGWFVVHLVSPQTRRQINDYAEVASHFTSALIVFQYAMNLLLAPIYFAGSIVEEKENDTLELLFTTQLKDHEILLGKFAARVAHLIYINLLGLPMLAIITLWGGVSFQILMMHFAVSIAMILIISSACLLASTVASKFADAIILAYTFSGAIAYFAGQGIFYAFVITTASPLKVFLFGLALMVAAVTTSAFMFYLSWREMKKLRDPGRDVRRGSAPAAPPPKRRYKPPQRPARFVPDDSLLWKELQDCNGIASIDSTARWLELGGLSVVVLLSLGAYGFRNAAAELAAFMNIWARVGFVGGYAASFFFLLMMIVPRIHASVTRERENGTLRFLLLLPIERSEILRAKFIAPLIACRNLLTFVIFAPLAAMIAGTFEFRTCLGIALLTWPFIVMAAGLAMLFTVRFRREMTANVAFAVIVLAAGLFHVLLARTLPILLDGCSLILTGENAVAWPDAGVAYAALAITSVVVHQFLLAVGGVGCWLLARRMFDKSTRARRKTPPPFPEVCQIPRESQ